jgi:hypothetical protein
VQPAAQHCGATRSATGVLPRETLLFEVLREAIPGNRKGPTTGRWAGAKEAPPLPEVPVDGDPDELLGASQAAALLGYKSVGSFSSSLSQGNLPLLKTTDGVAENAGRQNGRRRWTRRRILEQASQRKSKK